MRIAAGVLVLVACSEPSNDVVGPFTGTTHRYVVDRIDVPRDTDQANAVAADLDGDGMPENKFGYATAVLATTQDLSPHANSMIASGALASYVEITADNLFNDSSVGVHYFGAELAAGMAVGGRFNAGDFVPNRTRETEHPGVAVTYLPVFVNAQPVVIPIFGLEIELARDGADGFEGIMRGGILERTARESAHLGLVEMFETEPERHLVFMRGIDEDRDNQISAAELEASVIGLLVSADIALTEDADAYVSIAFGFHLTPCPDLGCARATPADLCRDRVRDGDETDVDCGGSCQPCWDGKECAAPADCQSNRCTGGMCDLATCSDGVRDGYESDIDCGGVCPACALGQVCAADRDCASGSCDNGVGLGSCI